MTYAKPMLRPIEMNADVAGCRECPRGYVQVNGLCLPGRTVVVVYSGDHRVVIDPANPPVAPAFPGAPADVPLLP